MEPTPMFKTEPCYLCHKPAVDFVLVNMGDRILYMCMDCDDMAEVPEEVEA